MRALSKWVLFAVVCALAGAGGALALSRAADEKPAAKEKGADEAWFPKAFEQRSDGETKPNLPPTAFPDLVVPELKRFDDKSIDDHWAAVEKRCPRLNGKTPLKIEPADDALRKLLKARLHQGILEYQENQKPLKIVGPNPTQFPLEMAWFADMTATVTELYAGQPKELLAWLEELLIAAKEYERLTTLRVTAGAVRVQNLYTATRTRLKIEAELWKAKHAK